MSSAVARGLRLALGTLFMFGAMTFMAPSAQAQWSSLDVCIFPGDISDVFEEDYTGLPNCEALCKKTAAYCTKFVKNSNSCWKTNFKGIYGIYQKAECANIENDEDRAECNDFVKMLKSGSKEEVEAMTDEALDECDAYRANCIEDCSDILL